ncbi:MAG: hypothetical protein Q9182_005342 [Xanthomendoza sp. 2 TL-2023]
MRLGFPIFDAEQLNYLVALSRAYDDISPNDLAWSFNRRYQRETNPLEFENLIEDAERSIEQLAAGSEIAAAGTFSHPDVRAAVTFWPKDGFREDENHKLFILAAYRHAYDLTCAKLEEEGERDSTTRIESNAPIPANPSGFLAYGKIKDLPYQKLLDLFHWREQHQAETTKES